MATQPIKANGNPLKLWGLIKTYERDAQIWAGVRERKRKNFHKIFNSSLSHLLKSGVAFNI
jgi:hypothetical protein